MNAFLRLIILVACGLQATLVQAQVTETCRPNIFGGQDCVGPNGTSRSQRDPLGGFDVSNPDGSHSSAANNMFGGEDARTRNGTIWSEDASGQDGFHPPDGRTVTGRPNIFGGEDFRTRRGTIESDKNPLGEKDHRYPDDRTEPNPNLLYPGPD